MNEYLLLNQFFDEPMNQFGVRELGRQTNLDTKTVMKYLKDFVNKGLILKKVQRSKFPKYEANRLSKTYKIMKSNVLMNKIAQTGLFDFLEQEFKSRAVVVFGSVQKGTYLKNSDVDIFIQYKERKMELNSFERKLGRDIQILFEENLNNLTEGLRNNIINGNTISGALQL